MRVVLDTNILVSGLLSAVGPPARIIQAVLQRRVILIMSTSTFGELEAVVRRPKLQLAFARAGVNVENFLTTVHAQAQFVDPVSTKLSIRDECDRPFLDLMATPPKPQYFVTGDRDFEFPAQKLFKPLTGRIGIALAMPEPAGYATSCILLAKSRPDVEGGSGLPSLW